MPYTIPVTASQQPRPKSDRPAAMRRSLAELQLRHRNELFIWMLALVAVEGCLMLFTWLRPATFTHTFEVLAVGQVWPADAVFTLCVRAV